MGNKFGRRPDTPPPPVQASEPPSPRGPQRVSPGASVSSNSSGGGIPRSESLERMTLFMNESKTGIAALAADITEASDCDINVYITAPPASGASQFCRQFETLTGNAFRFADVSLPPPGPVQPSDRTKTRIGQNESIRKHALVDVAKHWARLEQAQEGGEQTVPALSDAVRLKYDMDLADFDLLQTIEENGRARNGKFRFRVFEGSILDASTVPLQTCNRVTMLSDLARTGLEVNGNSTWERWTRTAPVSSSLFVYIRYDDATFEASYNAYKSRRDLSNDEKRMLEQLCEFHTEQKTTYDKIYYDGSPASVCSTRFVYILNCATASITQPAHCHFMIQEILKTIRTLQRMQRVWGAFSIDAERLVYLRTPGWVSGRIKAVPCNLFGGSYVSPSTAIRRTSLDESRSSSLSQATKEAKKIRRGSLEIAPGRTLHT